MPVSWSSIILFLLFGRGPRHLDRVKDSYSALSNPQRPKGFSIQRKSAIFVTCQREPSAPSWRKLMRQMSSSLVRAAGDTAVPHLIEVIFPRLKVPEPLARLGQTCRRIVFVSDPARGSLQRQIVTTRRSQDQPLTDSRDKEFVYFGVVASAAPVDSISFHLRQASHNQSVLGLLPTVSTAFCGPATPSTKSSERNARTLSTSRKICFKSGYCACIKASILSTADSI
jgi:hypothetical protein